jgi:CubicO group peptidase (beta-lactamase class C family)
MPTVLRHQPEGVSTRTGMNAARLDELAELFERMLDEGEHPGAQLAVFRDGELVCDLAGGTHPDGTPLTNESLLCILSTTKALTAMLVHTLHDRGLFEYDDLVARHWPEFLAHGKEAITVAHVLSHRAGMRDAGSVASWFEPGIGGFLDWQRFDVPGEIAQMMEDQTPLWPPGSACGYHAFSFGHILNELVTRWTGRSIGALLRSELCAPLGIEDVYLELPKSQYSRLSPLTSVDEMDGSWRPAIAGAAEQGYVTPPGGEANFFNSYEILRLCLAGSNGVARARDLACLMNVFAFEGTFGGHDFFSIETFARAVTPTNAPGDHDRVLGPSVRWGLGLALGMDSTIYGTNPSPRTCGHSGGGTSVAWADPDRRLTVAFLPNGLRGWDATYRRYQRVADAVLRACE